MQYSHKCQLYALALRTVRPERSNPTSVPNYSHIIVSASKPSSSSNFLISSSFVDQLTVDGHEDPLQDQDDDVNAGKILHLLLHSLETLSYSLPELAMTHPGESEPSEFSPVSHFLPVAPPLFASRPERLPFAGALSIALASPRSAHATQQRQRCCSRAGSPMKRHGDRRCTVLR